ncbi:MAG: hypothetical protein VX644_04460 [Planctomycetota bacterium]|nr:hypothetical protein [Planctomycetota bacterium]
MVLCTLPSSRWITLLLTAVLAGIQLPAVAQQTSTSKGAKAAKTAPSAFVKPKKTRFIQVKRTKSGEPEALQTAIVRYVPATGDNELIVDLIGAVHVGDRLYYQKLNKLFENYDVLLYELVAPEGTVIPKGGRTESTNPLSMIQTMMKSVLGLELQLEQVDYTKKNFVHADLSPEKMAEAMKKRGDDGLTLALGIAADFIRSQNVQTRKQATASKQSLPEIDPLSLLLDPQAGNKLKRIMAEQFDTEEAEDGLGSTLNTILISDRNKAALQVFQKEMVKGHKRIGIFYGAAHMPDFEKRLRLEYGLKLKSHLWVTAWDLEASSLPIPNLFKLLGN